MIIPKFKNLAFLARKKGGGRIKIYTRTGDRGKTSLFSGERVPKHTGRVEAYGEVDELNSILGALAASLPQEKPELLEEIQRIQSDLLHIGAWLATTSDSPLIQELKPISEKSSRFLEQAIDRMEEALPILRSFILPGGHVSSAWAHVARTVCRRTERHVVRLTANPDEGDTLERLRGVIMYLNRLSDYLFLFARRCNALFGVPDILWKR